MSNFKRSVLATAFISSAFISQAFAADEGNGRVHFTGTVINAPCSIAPNSTDINVDLGQVSNKVLETGNKHSENVSYNIDLQDCDLSEQTAGSVTYPAMSKVSVPSVGFPMPLLWLCWLTPVARLARVSA